MVIFDGDWCRVPCMVRSTGEPCPGCGGLEAVITVTCSVLGGLEVVVECAVGCGVACFGRITGATMTEDRRSFRGGYLEIDRTVGTPP